MAARQATAEWRGNLMEGTGHMRLGSGAADGAYDFRSRFGDGAGTNPEELIGAAQAACYAMQLAAMLGEAGTPANSISATANVELSFVDNAQSITKISIEATGDVPGLSEDEFKAKAEEAKAACLIARALAAVPEITLNARLAV